MCGAQTVLKALREAVGKAEVDGTTLAYVAKLACPLIDRKIFDKGDWVEVQPLAPNLAAAACLVQGLGGCTALRFVCWACIA